MTVRLLIISFLFAAFYIGLSQTTSTPDSISNKVSVLEKKLSAASAKLDAANAILDKGSTTVAESDVVKVKKKQPSKGYRIVYVDKIVKVPEYITVHDTVYLPCDTLTIVTKPSGIYGGDSVQKANWKFNPNEGKIFKRRK